MPRDFTIDDTWSTRPCPACQSWRATVLFRKENIPFVECRSCRTVYVNPTPPASLLQSLYDNLGANYFSDDVKLALDFNPRRYWRELSAIPTWARHGRLLDVGCATGSFLAGALAIGFADVRGIDISRPSIEYANQKMGLSVAIAADFLSQPFVAGEFDMVTLWATLEHVAEPEQFLRESCRVLKKGGMVCLSVPNRSGISMRGLGRRWHMVGLEHLNYFTPPSLRLLLERVGFVTHKTQTRSFNPLSFWKDLGGRHLSGQFGQRELLAEYQSNANLRRNPAIGLAQRLVDVAVTWLGVGDLLILTAQKT